MSKIEEEYYRTKQDISYRVRDIFLALDRLRDMGDLSDEMKDELAGIFHSTGMIEFSFKEAEANIDKDLSNQFHEWKETRTQFGGR